MRDNEMLIKTYTDDVNKIRGQLLTNKKDSGNYTVRDFTDEVYNSETLEKRHFVQGMHEGFSSKAFTNLLCVLNKTRLEAFIEETATIMTEYYTSMDATDIKRRPEMAKIAVAEIRDK
jgi:hypothetical protein